MLGRPQISATFREGMRLHTAGDTGSIPVAPTTDLKHLAKKQTVPRWFK